MADQANGAETPTESPQSRLRGAGFTSEMGYWRTPTGDRLLSTEDAVAALDAGEVEPYVAPWPGAHADTAHHFQTSEEQLDRMLGRNQEPGPEPPPLPSWAEPWAQMVAERLRPINRAEVRAALKAEARKREREHKA